MQTRIVANLEDRPVDFVEVHDALAHRVRAVDHRAQLEHLETAPVHADALLGEERVSARLHSVIASAAAPTTGAVTTSNMLPSDDVDSALQRFPEPGHAALVGALTAISHGVGCPHANSASLTVRPTSRVLRRRRSCRRRPAPRWMNGTYSRVWSDPGRRRIAAMIGSEDHLVAGTQARFDAGHHPIDSSSAAPYPRTSRRWPYFESKSLRFVKMKPCSTSSNNSNVLSIASRLSVTRTDDEIAAPAIDVADLPYCMHLDHTRAELVEQIRRRLDCIVPSIRRPPESPRFSDERAGNDPVDVVGRAEHLPRFLAPT